MTPYIEKLSDLLSKYDFMLCERHEVFNEVAHWKRPSVVGSNVFEYIAVSLVSKPKADAMFTACFGLSSPFAPKLENEADLRACSDVFEEEKRAIFGAAGVYVNEDILTIPINWLINNKGGEASFIWRFFSKSYDDEIESFELTLKTFVLPELLNFSNINSFRRYMFNLAENNKRAHAPGAVSPDTINFTSLICFVCGDTEMALRMLREAIDGKVPLNVRKQMDNNETYKKIMVCRMKKTLNYLTHMHVTK